MIRKKLPFKKKESDFKKISPTEFEWSVKSSSKEKLPKFNFKKISPTEFEWTLKTSKKEQLFKQFHLFLKKYNSLKEKTKLILKNRKNAFFRGMYQEYPKASIFYDIVFKKYFDFNLTSNSSQKRLIPYSPGFFIITPIVFVQKFHLTEKLLIDLEKRNLSVQKILKNDKATLKIVDHLIYRSLFKMSYQDFILEIEDIINNKM